MLKAVFVVFVVLGLIKLAGRVTDHVSTARADAAAKQSAQARASEALIHAKAAAKVLESYYKKHSSFPISLAAAEFDRPLPEPVQSIRVGADGTLRVVLMGKGPQEKRSFRFQPMIDSGGTFTWICHFEDVPPDILPVECARRPNGG